MKRNFIATATVLSLSLGLIPFAQDDSMPGTAITKSEAAQVYGALCGPMGDMSYIGCGFPHITWGKGYEKDWSIGLNFLMPKIELIDDEDDRVACTCSGTRAYYDTSDDACAGAGG